MFFPKPPIVITDPLWTVSTPNGVERAIDIVEKNKMKVDRLVGFVAPYVRSKSKRLQIFDAMIKYNVEMCGSYLMGNGTLVMRILIRQNKIKKFEKETKIKLSTLQSLGVNLK